MAIQAISTAEINQAEKNRKGLSAVKAASVQPSFQGLEQIPVAVADALTNGGFIVSFIAQDFFGMAGPRVLEGINRRPVNPETGKKEGPLNWKFARREGIREILSGPSAFIIPWAMLHFIKKYSGTANNVPVNMIQSLGNNFIEYANENPETLSDIAKTKTEFYNKIFKNVLNTTLEGKLSEEELVKEAEDFARRAIEIEQSKHKKKPLWKVLANKKVEGSPQDLTDSLLEHFMELKKKHLSPSSSELSAEISFKTQKFNGQTKEISIVEEKTGVGFKKLLKTMTDFTDDIIESTGSAMKKIKDEKFDPERFLNSFVKRRTGSRIISNVSMWGAVVGFYALIPKLYSLGLNGKNPAFAHEQQAGKEQLEKHKHTTPAKNDISFSGKHQLFEKTAEKVLNSNKLKSKLSHFEFDDASMSVSAMLALLYGFCLPTRLWNSPDKYDFKETILRDFTSFGAILFAANGIERAFSKVFAKLSGLALNITPKDHSNNFYTKYIRDYFAPKGFGGINVLSNKELTSKYTNIHEFNGGVNGFFDFITENGGNLKKMLARDTSEDMTTALKTILGKDLKDVADDKEIKDAFKNISGDELKEKALKTFENIFKDSKNKFVKSAKVYNSMFTGLSTIVLVPTFMIWLARTCDKMTRKARAKDLALQNNNSADPDKVKFYPREEIYFAHPNTAISMQGFLKNKT